MDSHQRTIIHIDLDCFYAQVEILKNPALKDVPFGVQQKNIVVTSNYLARSFGLTKCMLIDEAKRLCPNLVLTNGEDLYDYRKMSRKVTNLLLSYTPLVETLGFDENFIDVSGLIANMPVVNGVVGHVLNTNIDDCCDCGCVQRISKASYMAHEIRNKIFTQLGLTSCAGIAHNKLIAKIATGYHKPNQQSVVYPSSGPLELLYTLEMIDRIPGIGHALSAQLARDCNITTITDLQQVSINVLVNCVGVRKANWLKDICIGVDNSSVKPNTKPASVGIEDSCKPITDKCSVRQKCGTLLHRLMILMEEDGRVPKTIKLTIRRFSQKQLPDDASKRECKQCSISDVNWKRTDTRHEHILNLLMLLFSKMVVISQPFSINLLGISFSKLQEKCVSTNVLSYFINGSHNISQDHTLCTDSNFSDCSGGHNTTENANSTTILNKIPLNDVDDNDVIQHFVCPKGVDPTVFNSLPESLQKEIFEEYRDQKSSDSNPNIQMKRPRNTMLNYFKKIDP